MSKLESVERLAAHVGLRVTRDTAAGQWLVQRGQKIVHREYSLDDVQGFLSAWAQHVR